MNLRVVFTVFMVPICAVILPSAIAVAIRYALPV
jgi:hypothetical protein